MLTLFESENYVVRLDGNRLTYQKASLATPVDVSFEFVKLAPYLAVYQLDFACRPPCLPSQTQQKRRLDVIAEEGIRALANGGWAIVGALMDEAWRLTQYGVGDNQKLDQIYARARLGGALGGRLSDDNLVLILREPDRRASVNELIVGDDCEEKAYFCQVQSGQ